MRVQPTHPTKSPAPSASDGMMENPFAAQLRKQRSPRTAFVSAIKAFLFCAIALATVIILNHFAQSWLVERYASGYDDLNADDRITRLVDLSSFGHLALPHLTQALTDEKEAVARTAWELIQDQQNDWQLLSQSKSAKYHGMLLRQLDEIAVQLPDDRTTWANQLVQSTLTSLQQNEHKTSPDIQALAEHTLEQLSLSQRSGPSVLESDGDGNVMAASAAIGTNSSIRIASRSNPLPLESDWPLEDEEGANTNSVDETKPNEIDAMVDGQANVASDDRGSNRSNSNDSEGNPDREQVVLKAVDPSGVQLAPLQLEDRTALTTSRPLAAMDIPTLVRLLGSDEFDVRRDSQTELRFRQWTDKQIELAGLLVSGTPEGRLSVIDRLATAQQVDPRPWLLLLLDDPNRVIRHRVVSILATFDDEEISKRLHQHDLVENDSEIRAVLAAHTDRALQTTRSGRTAPINVYRR